MVKRIFKKRKESHLLTALLGYLQCQENLGNIVYCDRLNSGRIVFKRNNKFQSIRLCRKGTPDAFFITNEGFMVWLETKINEKQKPVEDLLEDEQLIFKDMISNLNNHLYLVITKLDDLTFYLDNLKNI